MKTQIATPFFTAADIIYTYSREQALEDGLLVDVSEETARKHGFTVPVAITRAVWADCVEWTEETNSRKNTIQDQDLRLFYVLLTAHLACRGRGDSPRRLFDLYRVPVEGRGVRHRRVTLAIHIGPGDSGEPVVTIMLPNED